MGGYVIDLSEIRYAGPFSTEEEARGFGLLSQSKGVLWNFETYPSEKSTPEEALWEWGQEVRTGGLYPEDGKY